MPSQQEVKWSQLKVGIIVLVSTMLLCVLLFLMTSASGMSVFSRKLTVHTYFQNSAGLKLGAPVELEGVLVGEVKSVQIVADAQHKLTPVLVTMKLDPKYHLSLHTDTKAALSTVGVLGDTVIDLNSKAAVGPELQDGAELGTLETPSLTDVVKASQGTVESLNAILAKMDIVVDNIQKGQGSVGKLINDPALYNEAEATVRSLHELSDGLNRGQGSVGKLLKDDQLYNRLNETAARLDDIAASLQAGKGSAGKLLKDEQLYDNLNQAVRHANSILADADAGKGALGLMTKDPAFARRLNDTMTQVNEVVQGINAGHGTLGKLAKDPTVYDNLNKVLVSSNELVTTIRQDPKKYLTIHLKIF